MNEEEVANELKYLIERGIPGEYHSIFLAILGSKEAGTTRELMRWVAVWARQQLQQMRGEL